MLSRRVVMVVAALVAGAGAVVPAAASPRFVNHQARQDVPGGSQTLRRVAGLPRGVPKAAVLPQPALPEPARSVWPFPSAFSRTSGTGRLDRGSFLWTDYLYDDHGAAAPPGVPLSSAATVSTLAPTQGLATYPAGPAHGNGADIFRAGVGLTAGASYWRVDWNTLVDPNVPIAEWTFNTGATAAGQQTAWPADAGVTGTGIDKALVVSAKAVRLYDVRHGTSVDVLAHGCALTVDRSSRSFVVRVPRRLLPVGGKWRVQLGAGLASSDGLSFAPADYSGGINQQEAAQLPRVYNVTFRSVRQEPPVYRDGQTDAQIAALQMLLQNTPVDAALGLDGLARAVTGNFWMEDHQADALDTGDVSAFSRVVDWNQLAKRDTTTEPRPRGYSNRWYVSRLNLGQGAIPTPGTVSAGDLRPNYLSRVQPYAVYVPRHMSLRRPHPLTWVLHSLSVNLNQYGALDPHLLQAECQDRLSICATTEGFGPDGWYFDEAEQDFWSVWHALAQAYRLDPHRTVMSGYSMGGWASYKLTLEHPDLFSQAMPLEGPPDCGIRVVELNGRDVALPASAQGAPPQTMNHCGKDGFSAPLLPNAKWVPYVVTQGGIDELVPFPSDIQATDDMRRLGNRYTFFLLPANDHLAYATRDRFGGVVHALGAQIPVVTRNPATIVYGWYPDLDVPRLGIGATTAYWITHLAAATSAPGALASVRARSFGIRERAIHVVNHVPQLVTTPFPAMRFRLTWRRGARSLRRDALTLRTSMVSALTINAARAGLTCPAVTVTTDPPLRVTFNHLAVGGVSVTLHFPAGRTTRTTPCLAT
ncbi:MAG: prolyl oligopeptidase family serine peptidase [Mycobacteriales bacterium]